MRKLTGQDYFAVILGAAYCGTLVGETNAFMLGNRGSYEVLCILLWFTIFLAIIGVIASVGQPIQRGPRVLRVTPEGRRIVDPESVTGTPEARKHLVSLSCSAQDSVRERVILELGYVWPITEGSLREGHDEREMAEAADRLAKAGLLIKDRDWNEPREE